MTRQDIRFASHADTSAAFGISGGESDAAPSIPCAPALGAPASYAPIRPAGPADVGHSVHFPVSASQEPVRGKTAARTLPKSVSIFGPCDGNTGVGRFEMSVGVWGIYLPLKRVSELLGISPILIERTMRRVSKNGMRVLSDISDTQIREPNGGIMDERSLAECFGDRDRILADVFACFLALPELLKAKRRAEVQKAARRRRAMAMAEERNDEGEREP